jgi:hypothetical protein
VELGPTLVIRPGALGDAILTLPTLHALRLGGASSLLVLGTPASWRFVRSAHESLRVRDFSSSEWLGLFSSDVKLGEAARLALSQIRTAVVFVSEAQAIIAALVKSGVEQIIQAVPPTETTATASHASEIMLGEIEEICGPSMCAQARKILPADDDIFLKINEEEESLALDRIGLDAPPKGGQDSQCGLIGIHPGSGGRRKCWPVERYAKLAVELSCKRGLTPLVFFGPADEGLRDAFEAAMPPGVLWEVAENRPLREVFALLSCCRAYVGNDSGMTHLAARVCPVTALFGPTDPKVWSPLGREVHIVCAENGDLSKVTVEQVLKMLNLEG